MSLSVPSGESVLKPAAKANARSTLLLGVGAAFQAADKLGLTLAMRSAVSFLTFLINVLVELVWCMFTLLFGYRVVREEKGESQIQRHCKGG